jgi:hypothetical protein
MTFEDDVVIAQTEAGTFSGVPDAATQSDFYSLSLPQTRTLQLVVRDESGSVIGPPGILSRIPAQPLGPRPRPTSSGTIQLDLLPDSANSIVFDSPTPADGTVFMWKTDTFTLAIAGNSSPTIPGSPFSAMTATGDIIMTDETATSPLPSQTTAYSISFPVGAMGAGGTAATGPQNFQWPWFDHVPLGGISGPTSRNIRYDLSGTIADTFGNKYPVLAASRKYRIDVAQTKQVFVAASIDSYMSATMFAAAAVIAGFAAAAAAASGVGWIAAAVAAAIAAGFLAASAYQTTLGQGQQSNAADPPSADPEYAQLYPFTNQAGEKLPETEGLGNLRQFIIACGTVTQIFPAISKTEGRILGARRANDTAGVGRQKEYLTRLLQVMSAAAARMASSANAAIQDIASQPITTGQLTEELATWPARGIPGNIQEKWSAAGLSPHEIGIIRNRLADPALRGRVVDYRNHIKSLSDHLTSAAVGVQDEAQKFLAI